MVSVMIAEGGSSGAAVCATADPFAMLELSVFSIICPNGCASILWKGVK